MKSYSLHSIILDARTNINKTFSDLVLGYDVSGHEEKLKELIYDARQDREFDYISVAERNEILEKQIIVVGELQHANAKYDRKNPSFISYDGKDTVLLGFKGRKTLEAGCVYVPYIPMSRGGLPKLVAEDLVSVQPMSEPCGLAFEKDYEVPEVKFESEKIVSKPRKLKCKWSMDQMADLSTYHLISNKTILESWASEIRMEIDKEIIESLKNVVEKENAAANTMHSAYSKRLINKNYLVDDPFLDTSTLKKNNMLNKSMSEGMDKAMDDFLDEHCKIRPQIPKIDLVEIPF